MLKHDFYRNKALHWPPILRSREWDHVGKKIWLCYTQMNSKDSMKKILAFISPLLAAFPLQVQALYQGNPSLPEIIDEGFFLPSDLFMGIKIGYQRDQVFNR